MSTLPNVFDVLGGQFQTLGEITQLGCVLRIRFFWARRNSKIETHGWNKRPISELRQHGFWKIGPDAGLGIQLIDLLVRKLHQDSICRRGWIGDQCSSISYTKSKSGNARLPDIGGFNALTAQELLVHEQPIEEDSDSALRHVH